MLKLLEGWATWLVTGPDPRRRLHLIGMERLILRPVGDPRDKGELLGGKHAPWLLAGGWGGRPRETGQPGWKVEVY